MFSKIKQYVSEYKLPAFVVMVIVFVVLLLFSIVLSNNGDEPELDIQTRPLSVQAIEFGATAVTEDAVGIVSNQSTITLVAQSAGPVKEIFVQEGSLVSYGRTILQQETAYAAGNALAVQAQTAKKNLELAQKNLESTVQQVVINREIAENNRSNTEELRSIAKKSVSETKAIIDLTESMVDSLQDSLKAEQAGGNDQTIVRGLQQQILSYTSSLNQARSSLRSLEYQVSTDSPQFSLADAQKEIVFASTELQLNSARIQTEIAELSAKSAQIALAATRVQSPFAGRVEAVLVRAGQYLSPGTPVAVLSGQSSQLSLEILVSGRTSLAIDTSKPIVASLNGRQISLPIAHVSAVPVSGQLYQVIAVVPTEFESTLYETQSVAVTLPLFDVSPTDGNSFIPLDALFVTNTERYVFVAQDGKAVRKAVETADIVGSAIEIVSGLQSGDIVILDRRVIDQQDIEYQLIQDFGGSVVELGYNSALQEVRAKRCILDLLNPKRIINHHA